MFKWQMRKVETIVETTTVLDLFNGKCQVEKCSGERKVIRHSVDGGALSFLEIFSGTCRCLALLLSSH